jgi:hypothetical protein
MGSESQRLDGTRLNFLIDEISPPDKAFRVKPRHLPPSIDHFRSGIGSTEMRKKLEADAHISC